MKLRIFKFLFCELINKLIKLVSAYQRISVSAYQRISVSALILFLITSCGFKVSSVGSNLFSTTSNTISGVISPLVGSIAEDQSHRNFLIESAYATSCADPVYAKLYDLQSDGSITESNPLATQQIDSNAKYSFNLSDLKLSHSSQEVEYLVKVEGCNGDVYKRPITNVDSKQDVDAATTVVAEVINSNSLLSKTLNQADRKDVDALIKSVSGTTITAALTSLTTDAAAMSKFNQIFGSSPSVLLSAKPEVLFTYPSSTINELAVAHFSVTTSHVNPNYSFAYRWKLDGVVKSTLATWNYIPGANESGTHQIDLYVGKNDGSGLIDTSIPYFTKTISINVNNNILPTSPNFSLNNANPTPVSLNTILVNLQTGVALSSCASFSHLAITDTNSVPGVMQFNIDCSANGTQTESVTFSSSDGAKTLYLWAIDNEGMISTPKTISLVLDSLPPSGAVTIASSDMKGGSTQTISIAASDTGSGIQSLDLFVSYNGGTTYSLIDHLATSATSYDWSVPLTDTTAARLKIVVRDFTAVATTAYSPIFSIDSAGPLVSITTPSGISKGGSSLPLSFSSSDVSGVNSLKLYYAADGVTFGAATTISSSASSFNFSLPSSNSSAAKIKLIATDLVGNSSETTTYAFVVDSTLPVVAITTPSGVVKGGETKLINFSASDINGISSLKMSYAADGVTFGTPVSLSTSATSYNFSIPSDDVIAAKLKIEAIDNAGNVSTALTNAFIVDSTAPTLSMTTPSHALAGGSSFTLNYSASDANTVTALQYAYASDGVSFGTPVALTVGSTSSVWSVPSDNTVNAKLKLIAIDSAGNSNTAVTSVFAIDSTVPGTLPIARSSSAVSSSTSVAISTTCPAEFDKVLYSTSNSIPASNDASWESCATSKTFVVSSGDGVKTIYAFTKNGVGTVSNSSSSVSMTLDTTAPTVSLTTPSGQPKGGSSVTLNYTASDATTISSLQLAYASDGTTFGTPTSLTVGSTSTSWNVPSDDIATAKLKLIATDVAGNVSTSTTNAFTVDSTSPIVAITTPSGVQKGGSSITLSYSASDTNTISSLQLAYASDGTNFGTPISLTVGATSSSWSVPSENTANAKLKLIATDTAGNVNNILTSAFTVDSTAPSAPSIARISGASSNSTSVSINTVCTTDYDKVLYSASSTTPAANDAAWESCASSKTFVVSSGDGAKTIYAFTKDSAGNISTSSNVTMTLDTTPPSAPVANLASAAISSSTTANFTITDCVDRPYVFVSESMVAPNASDSGWVSCSTTASAISYVLIGPVVQSAHTLYVYAKDAVGNISASTSANVTYDTTNPTLSLSTSLGLLYKGGDTVALSFSASDTNGLSSLKLEYTTDGTNYSLASTLSTSATSYTWTVPASNTTTAKIRLVAIDNATTANSTIVYSDAFTVDSTVPTAPTLARTSAAISSSTTVTMTVGSCTDTNSILITETNTKPSASASGWQLCSTTAGAMSATVSGEGSHTLYAWAKDLAGNVANSANSISMTLDTTAPVIAVTTPSAMQGNVSTGSVTWTLTETNVAASTNFTVEVYNGSSWASVGTKAANAGVNTNQAYTLSSFAVPNVDVTTAKIRVTMSDAAGNLATAQTNTFVVDSTAPAISSFIVNAGTSSTSNYNIPVSFHATDSQQTSHFCLKYNTITQPTLSDSCWISVQNAGVSAGSSINISNYYFRLGFSTGTYNVYVWLRDSVGNISSLAQVAGTDMATVSYNAAAPPTVTQVIAASSDSPSSPLSSSDLTIPSGQSVYIKWQISSTTGFGSTPVQLYYTTDDSTWTAIGSAQSNSQGSGCTISGSLNGCYVWNVGSPTSNYYKIKLVATDTQGQTALNTSGSINANAFKFLAGNTSSGVGASAAASPFLSVTNQVDPRRGDAHSLVVHPNGTVYFKDAARGILKIDPADGLIQQFIKTTGSTSGDGGAATSATINAAIAIALDYQNNLLILDNNRIRKVNLAVNPPTISTIIGGGSNTSDTVATATQLQMNGLSSIYSGVVIFQAAPNGDIIFKSECVSGGTGLNTCNKLRWYHASDGSVTSVYIHGYGIPAAPTVDVGYCPIDSIAPIIDSSNSITGFLYIGYTAPTSVSATCSYNSNYAAVSGVYDTSGAFVQTTAASVNAGSYVLGKDNKIYDSYKNGGYIRQYDASSNSWTTLSSSAGKGFCADGTILSNCQFSMEDLFVNASGKFYLVENGVIRTITDSNTLLSVMGQSVSYGDGLDPTLARFGWVTSVGLWNDGANDRIALLDQAQHRLREFSIGSGNISTIAGNGISGVPNTTSLANAQSIDDTYSTSSAFTFGIDGSGNVYMTIGYNVVGKLNRSTGKWSTFVGNGATNHYASGADGLAGTSIKFTMHNGYPSVFGFGGGNILTQISNINGSSIDYPYLKLYNTSTGVQSTLAGYSGTNSSTSAWCTNGTSLLSCVMPSIPAYYQPYGAIYDSSDSSWLFRANTTNDVTVRKFVPGGNMQTYYTASSGTIRGIALNKGTSPTREYFYYCDNSTSPGKIKKVDMINSPTAPTTLTWPISSVSCDGNNMIYSASRNSLIFIYKQNGLYGIIEYENP